MSPNAIQLLRTPAIHSISIAHALDVVWSSATEPIAKLTDSFASSVFKARILSTLKTIKFGRLTIRDEDGIDHEFGNTSDTINQHLHAIIVVKSPLFWSRVSLFTDLGFAESFMYGEVDCDDISTVLKILIRNRDSIDQMDSWTSNLLSLARKLTQYKFLGTLANSRANISAHYDLGNDFFSAILSKDMNYSSAIFMDYDGDLKSNARTETLEDAQLRKMKMILKKANVQPGDRVLEIGSGWGSLAILLAQTVDCTINTITLSVEQYHLATKRIREAGVDHRVTVHNIDFRECLSRADWNGYFDRFISIEMIENVGREFITEYWRVVDWALKPRTGVGVVQVISMPEGRIPSYDKTADFVQKWSMPFFPGGYIPSLLYLLETMNKGSNGCLTADSVANIGPHYARTLRSWKRNFLHNWSKNIKCSLEEKYSLDGGALEAFKRRWIYYFDYCEAGFATRMLGDHVITFTREGNEEFGCDFTAEE